MNWENSKWPLTVLVGVTMVCLTILVVSWLRAPDRYRYETLRYSINGWSDERLFRVDTATGQAEFVKSARSGTATKPKTMSFDEVMAGHQEGMSKIGK